MKFTRTRFRAMLAARAQDLELGGMSRDRAERAAQQEIIDKAQKRINDTIERLRCAGCGDFGVVASGLCSVCYRRALRRRKRIKLKDCKACGKPFQTTRKDAKTCSATCRSRLRRLGLNGEVGGTAQLPAQMAENAHSESVTDSANPLDTIEAARRELALANDLRNAATPTLHIPVRVAEMVFEAGAAAAERERRERLWNPFSRLPRPANAIVIYERKS
ncbi:hypothetical protein [Dongia sp. agr-C8]